MASRLCLVSLAVSLIGVLGYSALLGRAAVSLYLATNLSTAAATVALFVSTMARRQVGRDDARAGRWWALISFAVALTYAAVMAILWLNLAVYAWRAS